MADLSPNARARQVVSRYQPGNPLDPTDLDFLVGFVRQVLLTGGKPLSEARSKQQERNSLVAAAAETLYPDLTPCAAGRRLEALARGRDTSPAPLTKVVAEALDRLADIGLPGPKQVENVIREYRKRNGMEISST